MAYTRRQELMCTEDQMIAKPSVVLRENEVIYIKMNDGTLRQKIGDGATAIINLPFTQVFDGSVVQTTGDSETAVMSQKAVTESLKALENLERTTKNVYINGWVRGSIYKGTHQDTTIKAYTELFDSVSGMQFYFDDSTYKICFIAFEDDGITYNQSTSWRTESPAAHPFIENYKCRIEVTRIDGAEFNSDVSALENTVYYKTDSTSRLTKAVLELQNVAVYVDGVNGDDTNDGSKNAPFKTIQKGVDSNKRFVYVAAGEYTETVYIDSRDDITIQPLTYPNFDKAVPNIPLIVINGENTRARGMQITNCGNVELINIHCDNCTQDSFYIKNVSYLDMVHCVASNNTEADRNGFKLYNVNGVIRDCMAYNIVRDGFNIHGYGYTEFINCIAYNCGDDGISHHDGCTGLIWGGEYYNCGKGGVSSPTYGADVTIQGVYSHDNVYGIYVVSGEGYATSKGKIANCVIKNNTRYDIYLGGCEIIAWNNIYDTKSTVEATVLTEFSN